MRWLRQVFAVTAVNLRSIPRRLGSAMVAVAGFAGVVAVFVAVFSIASGFAQVMERGGSPRTVVVLRGGSDTEMSSGFGLEQARVIEQAPGIARGESGPLVSTELFVIVDLLKRSSGTPANVPLRGVGPAAFEVRPEVEIVEGRRFTPGRNEVIAGVAAAGQFAGLDVGNRMRWGDATWEVVGLFTADGGIPESEIWADARVLQPAYNRGDTFQSVIARLESAEDFTRFKDALTSDPRVEVDVYRQDEYLAEQSTVLRTLVGVLGLVIAVAMAFGATFGALNTMYNAVASRSREIATLRALGFQGGPVVISVLAESLLLALAGGLIGGGLAYLVVHGYQTATINWQSFSQVAFSLAVTPGLLSAGLLYALVMGFVGGVFPALRAARLPVAVAIRQR
jgi:putative ABC transport system permease protein